MAPRLRPRKAEQVMWIVEGDVTMTVGDETKTLGAGDVVVVNPGVEHELHSEYGLTFIEALAPVLRDHLPDAERDLVLGVQGDSLHADRQDVPTPRRPGRCTWRGRPLI